MNEITILYIVSLIQIVLALGLLNVWLVRFHKSTKYRGKSASNMKEEFKAYGLPVWFMYFIGFVKVGIAVLLLVGLWYPWIVPEVLYVLTGLMIGAIGSHIKVRDSFVKTVPAIIMFVLCLSALGLIFLPHVQ